MFLFEQEAYVNGLTGVDLFRYAPEKDELAYNYLKKSLKTKNQTNSVLLILLVLSLVVIILSVLGLFNLNIT